MTKCVGAVIFEDSARLYLVYDEAADRAFRPLFPTEQAARDWLRGGGVAAKAPDQAGITDEAVTIIVDVTLENSGVLGLAGRFASRASRHAMWLTGARSFLEMAYANGATASRESD